MKPPTESAPASAPDSASAPTVLELIARRTGYPADMLDPDLDLEAALGVDSLKRTEIAATLLGGTPHAESVGALADLRTIREMTDWLAARTDGGSDAQTDGGTRRHVVELVPAPHVRGSGGPSAPRSAEAARSPPNWPCCSRSAAPRSWTTRRLRHLPAARRARRR